MHSRTSEALTPNHPNYANVEHVRKQTSVSWAWAEELRGRWPAGLGEGCRTQARGRVGELDWAGDGHRAPLCWAKVMASLVATVDVAPLSCYDERCPVWPEHFLKKHQKAHISCDMS